MTLRDIDAYFLNKEEPVKGCMQALRHYILNANEHISEAWKYKVPMYGYKGKMFCHLWTDKKTGEPYICFSEGRNMQHPMLVTGDRKRMKILPIDPSNDLPKELLDELFEMAFNFYDKKHG